MTLQSDTRAYTNEPRPIVPVPAAEALTVRGQRVIIGSASRGWREDMRADELVEQAGKYYVPVLPEHDWYRSEAEQVETFAPLISVDRVWVETTDHAVSARPSAGQATHAGPKVRWPVRAHQLPRLLGRRLVWLRADGEERNLRAVSEAYQAGVEAALVRVAQESDWYRWGWTGKPPRVTEISLDDLWAE